MVLAWKHALHSSHCELKEGNNFKIKYLNDVFQHVGFIEGAYQLEKFRLNRDCTLVILNAAKIADMIEELIMNRCCNHVGWVYACDDRLLWVLDPRTTIEDVDAVFAEARRVLPQEDVFSFIEMEPQLAAAADTALYSEYSRYAPLDDGSSGDEEEGEEQRMPAAEEPQPGWQPVRDDRAARQHRARFEAEERRGKDSCSHRELCAIFKLSGLGKSPFTERNSHLRQVACTQHASKDDVPACPYLHRDQPRACVNCTASASTPSAATAPAASRGSASSGAPCGPARPPGSTSGSARASAPSTAGWCARSASFLPLIEPRSRRRLLAVALPHPHTPRQHHVRLPSTPPAAPLGPVPAQPASRQGVPQLLQVTATVPPKSVQHGASTPCLLIPPRGCRHRNISKMPSK